MKLKDIKRIQTNWAILAATFATIIFSGIAAKAQLPNLPTETASYFDRQQSFQPIQPLNTKLTPWRRVSLIKTLNGYKAAVTSLVFSRDGKFLVTGGAENDPRMKLWSLETGKELNKFRAQREAITAAIVSRDGKTLVSGGTDAGINLWNWETGEYQKIFLEHSSKITSLAIATDSSILVSGGLDGIRVWDLISKRPLYTLTDLGNPSNTVAINPNGYVVASGDSTGKVKFWNLRTGKYISDFTAHEQSIEGLTFTEDGKYLITASNDRTIKVWHLGTGELVETLLGHRGNIRAIALHPNGQTLASAGDDGVLIWNLVSGELLNRLDRHSDWVQSLAFSPDGDFLASGGYDSTVKIWQDSLQKWSSKQSPVND